jgi:hypothetical protein
MPRKNSGGRAHSTDIYLRSTTHATDSRTFSQAAAFEPVAIPLSKLDDLVEAIRSEKAANIVVVWHDATLPKILRALGAPEIPPIAHTEYDLFFILTFDGGKRNSNPRFTVLRYCNCAK